MKKVERMRKDSNSEEERSDNDNDFKISWDTYFSWTISDSVKQISTI